MNIYLTGFMGSGKSTTGKYLASSLDFKFIDLDERIESRARKSIGQIFEDDGEEWFRMLEKEALKDTFAMNNSVIATGGGTPCFHNNHEEMTMHGKIIYLHFPFEVLQNRLKGDTTRPLLKKIEFTVKLYEIRQQFYQKADLIIDAVNKTTEELVDAIKLELTHYSK